MVPSFRPTTTIREALRGFMRTTSFLLRKMFRRRVAGLIGLTGAFLLAVGTPVWAATYYLAPGGNDSSAGTSLGTAWLTLSKANSTLQAGDVVLIQPGTYSGGIAPVRDGGASSRISYVGSLTSPAAAVVASINLTGRSYISVKGVTSTGDVTISTNSSSVAAQHDSVQYIIGLGSLWMDGTSYSHVGHCAIGNDTPGDNFTIDYQFGDSSSFCTVEDNIFNLASTPGTHPQINRYMKNCAVSRNTFNIRIPDGSTDANAVMNYGIRNCTFTDNKNIVKNDNRLLNWDGSIKPNYGLNLRDECRFNSWVRDTFLVHAQSIYSVKYQFASSGTYNGGNKYNSWSKCFFQGNELFGANQLATGYSFFGNTFVMTMPFIGPFDSLTFRHNTIINTSGPTAIDLWGDTEPSATNSLFRSNIFYGTGIQASSTARLPNASIISDSNLVYSSGGSSVRAFYDRTTGTACSVGHGGVWCDTYGKDCHSQWGDPQFVSVSWANPNPAPRAGSIAVSSSLWPDGYVGAIGTGTSVGDLIPPGAVVDLALALISDETIVLRWTATGDDGTAGQASAYDLRWSNQPITASNFYEATPVGIQPVPAAAGVSQSYELAGLVLSTSYYFALRVADESDNWSDLSNVLEAVTKAIDIVPPAPITLGP
jgi:hypothetical protein